MKYLFFDIECCDGTHMCSFGYALCDEKCNIIKSDDILINPEAEYFRGMHKHAGFSLAYTEAQMNCFLPKEKREWLKGYKNGYS